MSKHFCKYSFLLKFSMYQKKLSEGHAAVQKLARCSFKLKLWMKLPDGPEPDTEAAAPSGCSQRCPIASAAPSTVFQVKRLSVSSTSSSLGTCSHKQNKCHSDERCTHIWSSVAEALLADIDIRSPKFETGVRPQANTHLARMNRHGCSNEPMWLSWVQRVALGPCRRL